MHKRAGTGRSQLADAVYTAYYLFSTTKNKKRLRVTSFFFSIVIPAFVRRSSPSSHRLRFLPVWSSWCCLRPACTIRFHWPPVPRDCIVWRKEGYRNYRRIPSSFPPRSPPLYCRRPRRARIAVLLPWVDATVPTSQDRHRALTSPYPPRPDRRAGLTTSTPAAVTVASGSLAARLKSEAIILPAPEATCGPPQVDIVRQPHTGTADLQSRGSTSRRTAAPGRLPNDAGPRTRNRLPAVARIGGPPLAADLCAISAHGRHRFARRWPHLQHPASISSLGHQFGEKIQFRFSYCSGRDARPICWTG